MLRYIYLINIFFALDLFTPKKCIQTTVLIMVLDRYAAHGFYSILMVIQYRIYNKSLNDLVKIHKEKISFFLLVFLYFIDFVQALEMVDIFS